MSVRVMLAAAVYIEVVNLAAYVAMLIDKFNARIGPRRISKATFLNLALIAQQTVRHKTHKESVLPLQSPRYHRALGDQDQHSHHWDHHHHRFARCFPALADVVDGLNLVGSSVTIVPNE